MNAQPSPEPNRSDPEISRAFELVAKDATVTVGILYGIGLLIANYYLLSLGFAEFEWLRTRYVFIGAIFVVPLIVSATLVYLAISTLHWRLLANHRKAISITMGVMIPLLAVSIYYASRRQVIWSLCLGVVIFMAFVLFQAPELQVRYRKAAQGPPERDRHVSPLYLATLVLPLALYFAIWAKFAFPHIPEQFGGAEPEYGYFFVNEDHVQDAQLVGLQVTDIDRETQGLRIVWVGSDYVIFQFVNQGLYGLAKVSDELFYAWVPSDNTDLIPMRFPAEDATPEPG